MLDRILGVSYFFRHDDELTQKQIFECIRMCIMQIWIILIIIVIVGHHKIIFIAILTQFSSFKFRLLKTNLANTIEWQNTSKNISHPPWHNWIVLTTQPPNKHSKTKNTCCSTNKYYRLMRAIEIRMHPTITYNNNSIFIQKRKKKTKKPKPNKW